MIPPPLLLFALAVGAGRVLAKLTEPSVKPTEEENPQEKEINELKEKLANSPNVETVEKLQRQVDALRRGRKARKQATPDPVILPEPKETSSSDENENGQAH